MLEHPLLLTLGTVLHGIVFLLITLHSLRRRRNASATLLWIFIAWAFPVIGAVLYLSFGIDRVPDRSLKKVLSNEQILRARKETAKTAPRAYWHNLTGAPPETALQKGLNRTLDTLLPDHPPLAGNKIRPLVNGDEAYPKMLDAIRNAKHHIHLQTFILGNDAVGKQFMEALAEKAKEGVEIRLLYDRFGSTRAHLMGLFKKYRGIPRFHIAGWTQANYLKKQFQINLRNHRKLLIIDGNRAFFGGINIHSENTSTSKTGPIRDYHFEVSGPLVHELQYAFVRDWHFITAEPAEVLLTEDYFPAPVQTGNQTARLIATGPVAGSEIAIETYFTGITLACKQIIAVTPYFVPPPEILRALLSAALRGVDVQIIVPKENNHRYAGLAGRALYEELLLAGVKIYERRPPFMHAKAMLIDSECALIGTANLDNRSLNLNYETTVAVYSEPFVDRMKEIVFEDLAFSDTVELFEWRKRPAFRRLLENLASLMNPVL